MSEMTQEAMEYLVGLGEGSLVERELNGIRYLNRTMQPLLPPTPAPLKVSTLTAVRDYLAANPDGKQMERMLVQVVNPTTVLVQGTLDNRARRDHLVLAEATKGVPFIYGQWYGQEDFCIALRSRFVPNDDLRELLAWACVGNVTAEAVMQEQDDGVSQAVTVRQGVKAAQTVPNPIRVLAPYRSFPEILPVSSEFLLRFCKGAKGTEFALFEADGGRWYLDTMDAVAGWLRNDLPAGVVVIA